VTAGGGWFRRFAHATAEATGRSGAFVAAVLVILAWAVTGPLFHFSDTWQLVINTGTTIVTFLMVFLIQNTQNRDAHAIHLKLDELIRANRSARNRLLAAEELSDGELAALQLEFDGLVRDAGQEGGGGRDDPERNGPPPGELDGVRPARRHALATRRGADPSAPKRDG
jgi:low affinity Fe/Cu permease